jgi:hypothetical protein
MVFRKSPGLIKFKNENEVIGMKSKVKGLVLASAIAAMTVSAVPAFAGTDWIPFSGKLPILQSWGKLSTDTNDNSSLAEAEISYVGSDYKMNLRVYDIDVSPAKQVSGTYTDADDGTTAKFNLDASSEGHKVELRGQTANWTIVQVEYSGKFRADS